MEQTEKLPKVLVCAPQHESKAYSFAKWWEMASNLTYPNYQVVLFDNSPSTSEFPLEMQKLGVHVVAVDQNKDGLYFTMADSHNACSQYAIENGFDYILHLETDVIPPLDVIERLMKNRKKVCAGVYDIFYGTKRKAMIQTGEPFDRTIHHFRNVEFIEDEELQFFDGTCKQVYHAGLGCILIRRDVLEAIPFRAEKGVDYHPDTFFANDCFQRKIPIYVDTTVQCDHHNQTWLTKIADIHENLQAV